MKTNENLQIAPVVNDLQLTATLPHEMVVAQQQLITWCDGKLLLLRRESEDLKQSYEHAKAAKWKFTTLEGQYKKSVKRISYYEKIKAALLEGYYIVPNFPISMFAIRTDKNKPLRQYSSSNWSREQETSGLPITVGEYKNPDPIVYQTTRRLEDNKTITNYWNEKWDDIDFPITMAKPEIMEAVSRTMALKIFDQLGIMPQTKNDDPVIIGQIKLKVNAYSDKLVSFMIAWHLNTNVL